MNPANFSNHGTAIPSPATAGDKQIPPQPKNESTQMLLKHVGQALQAQGPFTGWRERVHLQERGMKVCQIISSIRLIKPKLDIQTAISVALKFEEKSFRGSKEKADYDRECTEKLASIRDTRQKKAAMLQGGMGGMIPHSAPSGGMPMGGQNHPQQQQHMFGGAQVPRSMHGSPVAMAQQHSGMGMNPSSQHLPMQPQPFPQSTEPRPIAGRTSDFNALTPGEFEHVCRLSEQMAQKTAPADLERIKMNLQNMTPAQRQSIAQRGLDPLLYFFRSQALKEIKKHRLARMGMAPRPQPNNPDPGNNRMNDQATAQHQRQLSQAGHPMVMQGSGGMPMSQPGVDSGFIGNVDQIQGQQVDGLRSQEAGQLVVPATSTSQGMNQQYAPQQGLFPGTQQGISRAGMNPAMLAQHHQQQQALHNAQRDKIQHSAHFQTPADAQARAHVAAQAKMAMSSQANPQIPQPAPNQNPAMPMANRSMGPGQASQPRGGPPASVSPAMSQGQPSAQNTRPQIPPGLPPALHDHLSQLTPEQVSVFLSNYSRRFGNNQPMGRPAQTTGQGHPPLTDTSQGPQLMGDPNMRASMAMQQHLMGMGGMPPQPQGAQGQQPSMQDMKPNQFQHPNEFLRLQQLRQAGAGVDMTEDQVREMDRRPFPQNILNTNANVAPQVPNSVKTWGQLKLWATQNPQAPSNVNLSKLQMMQKFHFQSLSGQRQNANRDAAKDGAPQTGVGQHIPGQPGFNAQAFQRGNQQPGQQPPPNMPTLRPITANDIQLARQKLGPQFQKLGDDALRQLLEKNRQKQILRAHNMQAPQNFASHLGNPMQGPEISAPQAHQPQQMPATQAQQRMSQLPVSQPASAPVSKAPAQNITKNQRNAKQAGKGLKRPSPSDDEVRTGVQTAPQTQGIAPQTGTGGQPKTGFPQPTREQLATMNPQQKAQLETLLRKQQHSQSRQPITKDVADDAWAHLPENIKRIYAELVRQDSAVTPVAMTQEQRISMAQQLRESTDMLGRMDALIQWVAKFREQEKSLSTLLQMRMLLMKQFKGPDWTLADQFTISADYLSKAVGFIKKWFALMISRVQGSRQNQPGAAAPRPGGDQQPPVSQPSAQSVPLNASNLHQLEKQEAAIQRAKRAHAQPVPPAPTSMQPPYPLGATSPQGVPRAYGPAQVTQDTLVLPKSKKRKQNNSANETPNKSTQQASRTQDQAQTPTETQKPPTPVTYFFKCAVSECPSHTKGFPTQAALDEHVQENHHVEEPIPDALEFLLESYRNGLGIDKTDKNEPVTSTQPKPNVPATAESQLQSIKPNATSKLKQDGATQGAASPTVPMSTSAQSNNVTKPASPASMQAKPSQPGNSKEPPGLKTSPSKESKKDAATKAEPGTPRGDSATAAKDLWEDIPVSPEMIRYAFSDLGNETSCGLGIDPVDEILANEVFVNLKSKDSPSTDTGPNTQTPQDSDISKELDMDFGKTGASDDCWIPSDWLDFSGDVDGGLLMSGSWKEVNWNAVEANESEMNSNKIAADKFYSI